jgi:hypothetical protein
MTARIRHIHRFRLLQLLDVVFEKITGVSKKIHRNVTGHAQGIGGGP